MTRNVSQSDVKRCCQCILPATGPNIDFDQDGVCNYCRSYAEYGPLVSELNRLRPLFLQRIARARQHSPHECLVGLSGGKDSSYVAYVLRRKYGLNPLLVTYDNGFINDYARENIRRVVQGLELDHVYVDYDAVFRQPIYASSIRTFGVPCPGCTFPGFLLCIKLAVERQIPMMVHGRSRPQMFRELTDGSIDSFLDLTYGNLKPYDRVANKRAMLRFIRRLSRMLERLVPDRRLRPRLKQCFYPNMAQLKQASHLPELVGLFVYEPYDELAMMDTLHRELGWQPPTRPDVLTHEDCRAHEAAVYCYNKVCGQSMVEQELSTMIREGQISRDDALLRLSREEAITAPAEEAFDALAEMAGMSRDDIARLVRGVQRKVQLLRLGLRVKHACFGRPKLPLAAGKPEPVDGNETLTSRI